MFAAVPGAKADGARFVADAVKAGAAAVMSERKLELPDDVAMVEVDNIRHALALTAAKIFPRQPGTIAAVTGTSGKTSVAAFTRQLFAAQGHAAASIGTVGIVSPKGEEYGSLTTPDPVDLQRTLDRLAGEGVTHLALEASSHGLDQHRLDGVRITAGGFTNLSRDHLDYHRTLEAYLAAKLILFERLIQPGGSAVIAADGEQADAVTVAAKKRGLSVFTVGRTGEGLTLMNVTIDGFSQTLQIAHAGKTYRVRLPLVGQFQIENALVAAGLAIVTGGDATVVINALGGLAGREGPARACRTSQRRAGVRRLCAQAGRAREGARCAASLREAQACRRVRRWR